jgi:hypothetical protein
MCGAEKDGRSFIDDAFVDVSVTLGMRSLANVQGKQESFEMSN